MFDAPDFLTDPEEILAHLMTQRVAAPEAWAPFVRLAADLGAEIVPIQRLDMQKVCTGESPGDVWAYKGKLFIEISAKILETVLHEICHWLVALKSGSAMAVNFGDLADDEIDTCDAQIAWLLAHASPRAAWDVADFLQYTACDSDDTIRVTIENGMTHWARVGMPLTIPTGHLEKLAACGNRKPDSYW